MPKRKILLVDDEPAFTRTVMFHLEDTGRYEVRVENDGTKALDAVRAFRPDLVLLDIIMPGLDGAQVGAALREDPVLQHVPVIFLTAIVSRDEIGTQAMVIGKNPFIAKPATTQTIINAIDRELAKHEKATGTAPTRT